MASGSCCPYSLRPPGTSRTAGLHCHSSVSGAAYFLNGHLRRPQTSWRTGPPIWPSRLSGNFPLSRRSRCCVQAAFEVLAVVDPWAPGGVDSQSVASQLFAVSLFPYLGFLYFITKSNTAPKLTLFGFYFLLAFVGATIPAGIYAKVHYGTSLSNVDWLHGGAEFLLTLTNLFIVLGLRGALKKFEGAKEATSEAPSDLKEKESSSV